MKMPAIVCAAGHGKVHNANQSKLADLVGGCPSVVRVVANLKSAGVFSPIVVVVNHMPYGKGLMRQLADWGHSDVIFATQVERRGAAHATLIGLERLGGAEKHESFLTIFGEMPLIQPDVCRTLAVKHCHDRPKLTVLTCPHDVGHPLRPQLEKYTYLKSGWDNGNRKEPFLYMYRPEIPEHGDDIIGSVYCFDSRWYAHKFDKIESIDTKHDGFGPEYHLPKYVELAVRQNDSYRNVRKDDIQWQILGYNTLDDYRVIEQVCRAVALNV